MMGARGGAGFIEKTKRAPLIRVPYNRELLGTTAMRPVMESFYRHLFRPVLNHVQQAQNPWYKYAQGPHIR